MKNGRLAGMLALHVDDALYGGSQGFYQDVIDSLRQGSILKKDVRRVQDP